MISLNVELGNGKTDKIEIGEFDDPNLLTSNFLIKHKIDFKIAQLLTQKIEEVQINSFPNLQYIKNPNPKSKSFSNVYPNIFYKNNNEQ